MSLIPKSMAWEDVGEYIMSPPLPVLLLSMVLVLIIPIFLHSFVFQKRGLTTLPSILLAGPSGSGKTSLQTYFERGSPADTQTSQAPLAVECLLPVGTTASSNKYRSVNDPTNKTHKKFLLIDTPGHGKLRYHAWDIITKPQNLKGIIFLIDAANLASGEDGLREASEYLHDTLLILQKRNSSTKSSKTPAEIPVLIGANKQDLFTALPVALVKSTLESEITKIRTSREKGLLSAGTGDEPEDSDDWLGEMGSTKFEFSQMEEFNIAVDFAEGTVLGGDESDVTRWWSWVGDRL